MTFSPFLCLISPIYCKNMQHYGIKFFNLANKKIPLHYNTLSTNIFHTS